MISLTDFKFLPRHELLIVRPDRYRGAVVHLASGQESVSPLRVEMDYVEDSFMSMCGSYALDLVTAITDGVESDTENNGLLCNPCCHYSVSVWAARWEIFLIVIAYFSVPSTVISGVNCLRCINYGN